MLAAGIEAEPVEVLAPQPKLVHGTLKATVRPLRLPCVFALCVSSAFVANTLPLPRFSSAFVANTLPLPRLCYASVANTLHLPRVSSASVAKTLPLPRVFSASVAKTLPLPRVSSAFVAKTLPLPRVSSASVANTLPLPRVSCALQVLAASGLKSMDRFGKNDPCAAIHTKHIVNACVYTSCVIVYV